MKFPIDGTQRLMRIETFISSPTVISEGTYRGTLTTAGTGDYTITFTEPFQRTPSATVAAQHATSKLYGTVVAVSTTAVRVAFFLDTGVATAPTTFHVQVIGSDASDGQI